MISKRLTAVTLVLGTAIVVVAQKPEMTARELFFVPAAVTAAKKSGTTGAPAGAPKAAPAKPKTAQVAKSKSPVKTIGDPAPAVEPQEIYTDTEVKLVTASYSGPRPLGLKYTVRKAMGGKFRAVDVDSIYRSGDAIQLRVEANEAGYLYVVTRGSSGTWSVLFPSKTIRGGDNYVEAGDKHDLPSPKHRWTFDEKKGEERIFMVLSRKPVADLDRLIYDLNDADKPEAPKAAEPAKPVETKKTAATPKASGPAKAASPKPIEPQAPPRRTMLATNVRPIDDQLVGRMRAQMLSRDLVLENVGDSGGDSDDESTEPAAYIVEKSGKPDARLVVDLKLKHE